MIHTDVNASRARLIERFASFSGRSGRIAFAPGRVNLIGEHTDYTGGLVLPASLGIGTWSVAAPRTDRIVRVLSESRREITEFSLDVDPSKRRGDWSDYVAGVTWALQREDRRLLGADLLIASDVPIGSGLSSSAALEVSVAYALLGVADLEMSRREIAVQCCLAENEFVGTRCGIMDQFSATHGERECAVMLDCRDLSWRTVPLPPDHRWILANTMVRHELAHSEYNTRREECEQILMVASQQVPWRTRIADLNDEELGLLEPLLTKSLAARLRHLVSENRRVRDAVVALEANDATTVGRLLTESHRSLRTDFRVSCAELDLMVDETSRIAGVLGARMVGGGFGGCVLALVEAPLADSAISQLRSGYIGATGIDPEIHCCVFGPAGGMLT